MTNAAMLLSFDVAPEAIVEHDDWHTHEHLPERLSIPGFVRGSRWTAPAGQPRYFVMYEVEDLGILTSVAYLERLNSPTLWTAKMMTRYRGMTRGFCRVTGSSGLGVGHACLLIRFKPAEGKETALREWLTAGELPGLASKPGLASARLFESGMKPPITNEQRIRGNDSAVDWALLVTGYNKETVASLPHNELGRENLESHGAAGIAEGVYGLDYSLTDREVAATRRHD